MNSDFRRWGQFPEFDVPPGAPYYSVLGVGSGFDFAVFEFSVWAEGQEYFERSDFRGKSALCEASFEGLLSFFEVFGVVDQGVEGQACSV